jgi:hypothetical protein
MARGLTRGGKWPARLTSFFIEITTMGLDLLPRPTTPDALEFPKGMLHAESDPCPFKDDNNPRGILGTCCSLRGSEVAQYLVALGFSPLLLRLFEDKLPEEALEFAEWLRQTADAFHEQMVNAASKKRARGGKPPVNDFLRSATVKVDGIDWEFQLDEAFRVIEVAAAWHGKVAKLHCGVRAWY